MKGFNPLIDVAVVVAFGVGVVIAQIAHEQKTIQHVESHIAQVQTDSMLFQACKLEVGNPRIPANIRAMMEVAKARKLTFRQYITLWNEVVPANPGLGHCIARTFMPEA